MLAEIKLEPISATATEKYVLRSEDSTNLPLPTDDWKKDKVLGDIGENSEKHLNNNVALCVGWRSGEDRTVLCALPRASELLNDIEKIIPKVFISVFTALEDIAKVSSEGTCACIAVICPDSNGGAYLFAFNLGDSAAFLVTDNYCQRLTLAHKPNVDIERTRINQNRGIIVFGRLGGVLSVSRALGDEDYVWRGLSHNPQYMMIHLDAKDLAAHPRVMVASDGIIDESINEYSTLKNILLVSKQCSDNNSFASTMMSTASTQRYRERSRGIERCDDISVVVMDCIQAMVGGIFDGHGAPRLNSIVIEIEKKFESIVQNAVQITLASNQNTDTQTSSGTMTSTAAASGDSAIQEAAPILLVSSQTSDNQIFPANTSTGTVAASGDSAIQEGAPIQLAATQSNEAKLSVNAMRTTVATEVDSDKTANKNKISGWTWIGIGLIGTVILAPIGIAILIWRLVEYLRSPAEIKSQSSLAPSQRRQSKVVSPTSGPRQRQDITFKPSFVVLKKEKQVHLVANK